MLACPHCEGVSGGPDTGEGWSPSLGPYAATALSPPCCLQTLWLPRADVKDMQVVWLLGGNQLC